ncbi:MAG TPA: potassium/proton antiporter [Longimicrobiales bacterium]
MVLNEPMATAVLLTTFAVLLGVSALFGRAFERMGVPVVLGFLAIGVIAGLPQFGINFDNYRFAFRIGTIALVLIIFEGGLNTTTKAFRRVAAPALVLATLGVVITAVVVAVIAVALGVGQNSAMLLGAVVSSTDAAAVFSVLRGSRTQLKHRVATILEVESGINDPVAVLLTLTITEQLVGEHSASLGILISEIVLELVIGTIIGLAVGRIALLLFRKIYPQGGGLMAVVTTSLALLSFGLATILHGSGFVAVYAAAITLGNGRLPMRGSVIRFHDAFGWLSQISMFLVLGLLAVPGRILAQLPIGLAIAFGLTFIARPLAVFLSLRPFSYSLRDVFFIGWVGLRGAVPIVLAIFPVMAGYAEGETIFDVVFVIVVLNALVPGSTVRAATRLFKLEEQSPPMPSAVMQIEAAQALNADLVSFYVTSAVAAAGVSLADLPFPEGAAVSMIVRGQDLIPPKGSTILEPGDHVYVITRSEDRTEIQLLFGKPELD